MPKAATKAAAAKAPKAKKVKDPNAPKKPCGAYMFFCKDKRNSIKAAKPALTTPEIGKELGRLWGTLSDGEKAKYNKQAEQDKARYEKEKAAYERK
jgi:hypothetical protein